MNYTATYKNNQSGEVGVFVYSSDSSGNTKDNLSDAIRKGIQLFGRRFKEHNNILSRRAMKL